MIFDTPIRIGELDIPNRLVMPPMQTNKTDRGHVTAELVQYYHDRAVYSRPGIIIADAEKLLSSGKADLIGVGRALLKDAHWRETA